jgi:2-dehydro-3-deoxyphosphooctonate aldolase (KDO 8-P synthase)
LVLAAAKTGKAVNLKKGQFMAPEDMGSIAEKIESVGNHNILLTERGTFFGYHNLVVDMRSLVIMRNLGYPVVFDATHSLQLPGSGGGFSGGQPQFIFPLVRAAVACGCDALFIETHPDVENALCDKDSMLPLEKLEELLVQVIEIDKVVKEKIGVARLVSRQS